jgi:hypothetical protein
MTKAARGRFYTPHSGKLAAVQTLTVGGVVGGKRIHCPVSHHTSVTFKKAAKARRRA